MTLRLSNSSGEVFPFLYVMSMCDYRVQAAFVVYGADASLESHRSLYVLCNDNMVLNLMAKFGNLVQLKKYLTP